jgi:hypothetical protein
MTKINGHLIREVLKEKMLELTTINSTFEESLYKFESEEKPSPAALMARIMELETAVAKLQTLQSQYNLTVMVQINEVAMPLEEAIKLVGGAGRSSKRWREAAKGEKVDRYERRANRQREKDKEYTVPTISKEKALEYAKKAEQYAGSLRKAIALGILTDIEFDDSVAALLE